MKKIKIFYELKFKLDHKKQIKQWIKDIILSHNKKLGHINYIFCSDDYLLKINQEFLNHDDWTDIITFNYNEKNKIISDIYISIDRVRENAQLNKVDLMDELKRVMIHGVLHLIGFNDKTSEEKEIMTIQENKALEQLVISN